MLWIRMEKEFAFIICLQSQVVIWIGMMSLDLDQNISVGLMLQQAYIRYMSIIILMKLRIDL